MPSDRTATQERYSEEIVGGQICCMRVQRPAVHTHRPLSVFCCARFRLGEHFDKMHKQIVTLAIDGRAQSCTARLKTACVRLPSVLRNGRDLNGRESGGTVRGGSVKAMLKRSGVRACCRTALYAIRSLLDSFPLFRFLSLSLALPTLHSV